MGRARDYHYAVYQFYKQKQKLVADHMLTIDVAETLAKERAKITHYTHIVVNQVTQAIISRFDGVELKQITPSPQTLQQPGGTTIGDAIQASRLTEERERKQTGVEEKRRKKALARATRTLCPGHWEDLNSNACTPGYARCRFRQARESGIPNSYFVDRKIAQFYDSRRHKDLGGQKVETGGKPNGSVPGGAETSSLKEGLQGPDTGPGTTGS